MKKRSIAELEADNERLRRLDAQYGEVEGAIIMADSEFDGDSDHESPAARLIASVERLRTKAHGFDLLRLRDPDGAPNEALMRGYGIGSLVTWANDPATEWKSPGAKARFLRHLTRAYLAFRVEHETLEKDPK